VLLRCNILLTCTIKSFASQAATNASVAADARDDTSSAKEIDMAETDEDPLAATGEDPVVETGKASVIKTGEAAVAKTRKAPVAETRKAFVVETREDHPMVETSEDHPVVTDFENLQKLGNGGVKAAASAASSFAGSFQMFADEATDYSKKSLESGSAFIEKLRAAKSLESAIQIQSDYAKSAYAEFLAYLVKMSDLYCNLFKRGATPIEKAAAKIEGVKT
jgi:Phasin protein